MDTSIKVLREEAIAILREEYPKVKAVVCKLEVYMRMKSRKAVYELRDFLDHLAKIFQNDISIEDAKIHLAECRTHLRRCSVEPIEYQAEKTFVNLDKYSRLFSKLPLISKNPLAKASFYNKMSEVKDLITKGRRAKTEGTACELFDKAFSIGTELLAEIHPLRYVLTTVLWIIGIIATGLIGFFVGKFFN